MTSPITPATPGAYALFDGGEQWTEAVQAWDNEGHALVVDTAGDLIRAEDKDGFLWVNGDHLAPPTIIPAPPNFTIGTKIVVGFLIDNEGMGVPLVLDGRIVCPADGADGQEVRYAPTQVVAP